MTVTLNSAAGTTSSTDLHPQMQQVYEILQNQNDKIQQIESENKQLRQQLQQLQLSKHSGNAAHTAEAQPSDTVQQADNNTGRAEPTALDIWKHRVTSEHRIIQQLYAFLKSQKQTLRDIVTELQYQQQKWKNDKHKLLHKLKYNQLTPQQSKKLIHALNQRKHELDNSTDALNSDISQLKSIKQWCLRKENILNQLDAKVSKLMQSMPNQTDALHTIDSYWNQYIVEQQTTAAPTMSAQQNDNNNQEHDEFEHKSTNSHKHTPSFHINKHNNGADVLSPVQHNNASLNSVQTLGTLDTSNNNNGNTANHNFSVHNQTNATVHNDATAPQSFVRGSATANIMQTPKSATLLKEMLNTWISQRKLLNDSLQTRMQRLRDQPVISISSTSTSPTNKSQQQNALAASDELLHRSQELKQTIASPRFPFSDQSVGMFASHSIHATPVTSPTQRTTTAFNYSVQANNNVQNNK